MRQHLVFDKDRCLACKSCELACAVIHSQSKTLDHAILEEFYPPRCVAVAQGKEGFFAQRCLQCAEPLCVFSCKSGALYRELQSGRVFFDEKRCVGCHMCLMVCPSGVRAYTPKHRVARCDLCHGREVPACVPACPTHALSVQTLELQHQTSDFAGHLVVVGSSAAGIAACETVREAAPKTKITMVTADRHPSYSRPLLAYVLANRLDWDDLNWRSAKYLEDQLGVRVLWGTSAKRLLAKEKRIVLEDNSELPYDRLIIATGARGAPLKIAGAELAGVYPLRDREHLSEIERLARPEASAVVLGGGNVGLQACEAFLRRGMKVAVVVKSPHLLSQMVDQEAGRRVGELFTRHGLNLCTGREAVEILGQGKVQGVRLDNGVEIPADVVIVGKGIRPNVEWLEGSGLRVKWGVNVDLYGRTNRPDVFAAGDCAETADPLTGRPTVSGIWPVAYEMGRAAASTALGLERPSGGGLKMNASHFFDEPIISIGEVRHERVSDGTARVLVKSETTYRKLVFSKNRLVGALLYGDISAAGYLYRLYRKGVTIEETLLNALDNRTLIQKLEPLTDDLDAL